MDFLDKMGKIIKRNIVKREKGKLYYIDGEGNLCEAELSRGGRKKGATSRRKYQTQEEKERMMF